MLEDTGTDGPTLATSSAEKAQRMSTELPVLMKGARSQQAAAWNTEMPGIRLGGQAQMSQRQNTSRAAAAVPVNPLQSAPWICPRISLDTYSPVKDTAMLPLAIGQ